MDHRNYFEPLNHLHCIFPICKRFSSVNSQTMFSSTYLFWLANKTPIFCSMALKEVNTFCSRAPTIVDIRLI